MDTRSLGDFPHSSLDWMVRKGISIRGGSSSFCCLSCFGSHVLRCHGDFDMHVCEVWFRQGGWGVRGVFFVAFFDGRDMVKWTDLELDTLFFFRLFLIFFFASNRARQVGREEEERLKEERATEWMNSDWIGLEESGEREWKIKEV